MGSNPSDSICQVLAVSSLHWPSIIPTLAESIAVAQVSGSSSVIPSLPEKRASRSAGSLCNRNTLSPLQPALGSPNSSQPASGPLPEMLETIHLQSV